MVFLGENKKNIDIFFAIETFIRKVSQKGLKAKAFNHFIKSMIIFKVHSENRSPFVLFCNLFQRYQIYAELRSITKSGRTYKVPYPVLGFKRVSRLISIFLHYQRLSSKPGSFFEKCGDSFFEWSRRKGSFVKLLKDLSLQVLDSRPYMKYARRKFI